MSINTQRRAAGLPEEPARTFTKDEVNDIVEERLARERRNSPRVESVQPRRTYSPGSGASFYADIYLAANHDDGARARRDAYAREVAGEINRGSAEGRYAEGCIRESFRSHDERSNAEQFQKAIAELRALATGEPTHGITPSLPSPAQGAAFVTPFILNEQWAPFRGRRRPFADQCMNMPLPAYGMHGYIPAFTSTTGASLLTEGSVV